MPTLSEVHVDQALTDFTVAFLQDDSSYVARRFAPPTGVARQSNKYHIYDKGDFFRSEARKRSPNAPSAGRDYSLSTDSYFCDVWAVHYDVSEQETANADAALESEEDAARLLMQDILIAVENEFATAAFTAANWDTSTSPGTKWDSASSTPIEDATTGQTTILQNTGKLANTMLAGYETWASGLRNHPDLLDRIKHTQTGVVTPDLVAGVLELDQVLVARAIRNTAGEGETESDSFILGDDALVAFVDPGAGLRGATAMKTFTWSGLVGSIGGVRTKRFDIPESDAFPRVETDAAFDFKVVSSALGYHLPNTIS